VEAQGEVAELKDNINQMIANLRETTQRNAEQDWLKTNLAQISGMLQGQRDLEAVTQLIMSEITPTVSAQHGAFFLAEPREDGAPELVLAASYGLAARPEDRRERFSFGEGLVGQAASERKTIALTDPPDGYIKVVSGLGQAPAAAVLVMPVLFEDQVLGVIELGSLRPFSEVDSDFLDRLTETIGVVINTIRANMRTEELLEQSQSLTQELQKQSEELRQTNEELQEKARLLSEQNRDIEIKNEEIELARRGLEDKAAQLALASKYKSEFLANMSHELRTPLNSMLILSQMLAANEDLSLTEQQVEFARTIHTAGNDLLSLINDILDLSKVEAGRMELELSSVPLADIADDAERGFRQVAEQKGLAFAVDLDPALPPSIVSDRQRIGQILKNLLSNAFKFTHDGGVTLGIAQASAGTEFGRDSLRDAEQVICFSVTDSGVGIPEDKLEAIFEAFQQADGTTSRKYGGTGLGLSISREIARLLGGEIHVESMPGKGSRFSLFVPLSDRTLDAAVIDRKVTVNGHESGAPSEAASVPLSVLTQPSIDDREQLGSEDRVMLVVASPEQAQPLREAAARRGARAILVGHPAGGLGFAREHRPQSVLLRGDRRWVETLLGQLKKHPETRHIPVLVLSDPAVRLPALRAGAAAFVEEPLHLRALDERLGWVEEFAGTDSRRIMLIDENRALDVQIGELLGGGGEAEIERLDPTGAFEVLRLRRPDLTVVVVGERRDDTLALLRELGTDPELSERPQIAYLPAALPTADRARLQALSKSVAMAVADTPERLVERASLYLHRPEADLPARAREMLAGLRSGDTQLQGRKVLVVDDDIRNVFALTSSLEQRGMKVVYAENGREGLERLAQHGNTDLVLLDIMMPEMDGYETAQAIRGMPRFEHLPIIAVTAKAMKGDREKAIAAGASDYITKPVDIDQLVSMMRVWLDA
jgi:signal transduction histidine kinase/CheY-like chemotaxis protein